MLKTKPKEPLIPKVITAHTLFCANCETYFFEACSLVYFFVGKDPAIEEHLKTCEGEKLKDVED
jgi:hypothetical protein